MFTYKKIKNFYKILKKNKNIYISNDKLFIVPSERIAISIINELNSSKIAVKKTPISDLASFACNLNKKDRITIIKSLKMKISFDNILYRPINNVKLRNLMDKKYNDYIGLFSNIFSIDFKIILGTLGMQKNLKVKHLEDYLLSLNNFFLTVIFKLTQLSNSVIISYFFIIKQYGIVKFRKLSNLENDFQINNWGLTEEQEVATEDLKLKLKNISHFFKNLE